MSSEQVGQLACTPHMEGGAVCTWRCANGHPEEKFLGLNEWWYLVPDQSIFASGGNVNGQVLNLAARHKDGKWIMVYLGSKSSFTINMSKITAAKKVNVFWIDPITGNSIAAGSFPNTGKKTFSTPDEWEDALLILQPADTNKGP